MTVPYEIMTALSSGCIEKAISTTWIAMSGYVRPAWFIASSLQDLRNILIISATPYQWKHMIGQRICRRNTDETRIVLLMVWRELYALSPTLFSPELTGAFCQRETCKEGKMFCGKRIHADMTPMDVLAADYPFLVEGGMA